MSGGCGLLLVAMDQPYPPGLLPTLVCQDCSDAFAWQQQLLRYLIAHFDSKTLVSIKPCGKFADTAKRLVPGGPFVVDEMATIQVTLSDALHINHVLTSLTIGGVRRQDLSSIPVRGNWIA